MATTEAVDVVMPQMGVSVSEGTITKWFKQEGDQVEADEPLLEISTDKVDTEVPSPGSGVLSQILVQEGETVDVGTKLAVIGGDGADGASGSEPQAQEAPPEPAAEESGEDAAAAQQPPAPKAPAPPPAPAAAQPGESFEPMTAMRKGIAEHMRRSLDTSAHVTSAIEVDMSKVSAIRAKLKQEYQQSYGVNPTYLIFVARAATETLREYPWVNGEIRGDQIVTRSYVNLGFAVELQDGKGLIVPVVKNAEGLNLLGLARAVQEIARRAREKQLLPDDVQ